MSNAQRRSESPARAGGGPDRFWAILGGVLAVSVIGVAVLGMAYGNKLLCGLGFGGQQCALAIVSPADVDGSNTVATMADGAGQRPGAFLLPVDNGVELDGEQPTAVSGPAGNLDHGDLFYDDRTAVGNKLYTADHPLAVWAQRGQPTADACADAISTAGVWSTEPVTGQVLCVQSTGGQLAALTVQQVGRDGVEFAVTLLR